MTEFEKTILEKLEDITETMNQRFEAIDQRFVSIDQRFVTIDQRFEAIDQRFEKMDKKIDNLADTVHQNQLFMENVLCKQIRAIGEGHDFLKRRLDEALQMEKKREKMELDIISLTMDMKKVKKHLNMA